MSHYYDENQYTKSNRKELSFRFWCLEYRFIVDNGVFSKDRLDTGTSVLLNTIKDLDLGTKILDLGCGYGVIGIILKKYYPKLNVDLVDINERALGLAKDNAKLNDVLVNIFKSNGLESINNTYDSIITNPPIRCGKKVIYQFFSDSYNHLINGGSLYIVIRKNHGAKSAVDFLKTIYQEVELLNRDKGFWIIRAKKLIS